MKNLLSKKTKKKGFTLIELIIVLAIVAIIAAIAIPNFTKVRSESKTKADTQSAETIKRITQTLLAEDKLVPNDEFTIDFTSGSLQVDATKVTKGELSKESDKGKASLEIYFKEVKKPQEDNKKMYKVTIDSDKVDVKITDK